ncbi:right-handed parallel beta-helix repeat-containing protein (plasmid) [Borrelia parkeri]|nr:right-handed parallel beta-helix repeat-containing protein [Borrelia parkeri]UPA11455.1 right-handed parallel beta-helix repeat-containing protein [Borrelia parkeri]
MYTVGILKCPYRSRVGKGALSLQQEDKVEKDLTEGGLVDTLIFEAVPSPSVHLSSLDISTPSLVVTDELISSDHTDCEVESNSEDIQVEDIQEEEEHPGFCDLSIVFFTDEGQFFDLTPYTDISSVSLELKIVDPTLKTASSSFKFEANGLSDEFLDFLFFRKEEVYVNVSEGSQSLFKGVLEKFFNREVFNSTKSISFTVNDYSKLLSVVFEKPIQFPVNYNPDWLYVYNPLVKELSVVHLILQKSNLKDLIDDDGSESILAKIPAVIIADGEDLGTILSALLYEFGYAYTFTCDGKLRILPIWKSEVIKRDVKLCSIDASSYILSKSSSSSYDSTRVIWREGKFQSKEEAISNRRPLYSAPINVQGSGSSLYVAVLQKGVVYPDFADKVGSLVYQEYDPKWFDTAYKWDFKKREVWHDHYAINDHLAIISTHNLESRFSADSDIKLVHEEYYPTKARIWFKNTSSSQGSRYIYYFDIYGDVFYTTARNILQTDNADDFYSKRFEYSTRFIFDSNSAVRLFEFLTNLRVKGHTIVNFRSTQELDLTDFVRLKFEDYDVDHFFLILSKKISGFDMNIRLYEYEGITWGDYTHYDYLTTSKYIGSRDNLEAIREVIVAPFNYIAARDNDFANPHLVAPGFKDEVTFQEALSLARRSGTSKIRLLPGDFYMYGSVDISNFELKGEDGVVIRAGGFAKNIFTATRSFKMSRLTICQKPMSELWIRGGNLSDEEHLDSYLKGSEFVPFANLRLCSSYRLKEEERSSIYLNDASFIYLKNITFLCNEGVALETIKVKKILLENVIFRSTNCGFDISDVDNMTLIGVEIESNKKASVANGVNAIMRGGVVKKNRDGLHFANFSSLKVNEVEFLSNTGVALELDEVVNARFAGNSFVENKVGLKSNSLDLLMRDSFLKNEIGMSFTKKSDLSARVIDFNVYEENIKDKEEVA